MTDFRRPVLRPGRAAMLAISLITVLSAGLPGAAQAQRAAASGMILQRQPDHALLGSDGWFTLYGVGVLDSVVRAVNARVRITGRITLTGSECTVFDHGQYLDVSHTVEICYDLADSLLASAVRTWRSGDVWQSIRAVTFLVFHSVGHAVINVTGMSFSGSEEDAADQFAAWVVLTSSRPTSSDGLVNFITLQAGAQLLASRDPLLAARARNLECYIVGALGRIQGDLSPPAGRTQEECEREWRSVDGTWSTMIGRPVRTVRRRGS